MSLASNTTEIEYPESDGMPMGETDLHIEWMFRLRALMRYRYRQQRVYVASNLLLYYEQGMPLRFVVPDVFVVLDHEARMRRTYKLWEERKPPDVVFEVTSKSTQRDDHQRKPQVYEEIGVAEYFLYDPSAEYLRPAIAGYRMVQGAYRVIEPNERRQLVSEQLCIMLELDARELVLRDAASGEVLLTADEAAERRSAEAERRSAEAERRSQQAEQERDAIQAEHAALQAELERLRSQLREPYGDS